MSYLTDDDFERIARNLRVNLDIDDELRLDVIDVVQKLKHRGDIADYVRVPDHRMLDADAKFNPDDRNLYLQESTYNAAKRGEPRARWTVAHEIGHIALEHRRTRNRSSLPAEIERIAPTIRRDETQAHKLAAAFLAPFHRADFSLETTATQLADRFGISLSAATRRVEELAPMFRRLLGIQRPLPQGVVDFLAEAQRKGHKVMSLAPVEFVRERFETPRYEGELCPVCSNFRMVRAGTSMRCDFCGAITGHD